MVRFVTPPPIPDVPEPLRGTPLLTIDGACIGTQEEGEAAFAPLREIGETIMDTFEWMPTAGLSRIHMDPEKPGARRSATASSLGELTDEAIDAWVGIVGPESGSPLLLSELRHLGGALGRPAEDGGALSHLDAGFAMYSVGMPMTPELGEAIPRPPREDRRDDEAVERRGRLLQLHRRALRRRRDPAPGRLRAARRGEAQVGPARAGSSPITLVSLGEV